MPLLILKYFLKDPNPLIITTPTLFPVYELCIKEWKFIKTKLLTKSKEKYFFQQKGENRSSRNII